MTLLGPEIVFGDERRVAVSGARFELTVNSYEAPCDRAFVVPAGGRLRFGRRARGARAYLAVDGGIDVPAVLGSRATHLISAMGGLEGRALRADDRLPLGAAGGASRARAGVGGAHRAAARRPRADSRAGRPAGRLLRRRTRSTSCSRRRTPITQQSDRMGFRLDGPPLTHARGADIISDATPLGVLQVPASGLPILLMADRQTAGGYPKIATVITADICLAGQLGPGDAITFVVCTDARGDRRAHRAGAGADGGRGGPAAYESADRSRSSARFGADRIGREVPLAPMTTFRVGGPAEVLLETRSSEEIVAALAIAYGAGARVTILGGGSNVLVSDRGVRGLVIRPRGGEIQRLDEGRVRADAAVTINGLVRWTINHGCAGLEAWAGTPGTRRRGGLRQRAFRRTR